MHQTAPEVQSGVPGDAAGKPMTGYRESPTDSLWPSQGNSSSEHTLKHDKEVTVIGPPSTAPLITFYLAQSDESAKRQQLPTFANSIWSLNTSSLLACNQEFCYSFGYPPTSLSLSWRHLVVTDGSRSDPKDMDLLEESHRRLSVIHNLLQAGKLQSCSARLFLVNSAGVLLFYHVHAVAMYDDHGAPCSVMWLMKKLPNAETLRGASQLLPPETNIGEALREASILSYEQSESKLVEIKRKKPPPTESRKPWDNNLAKFSLKRVKRPDEPSATSGGSKSSSGSPLLPPKTISVVNPFSIAHLQPHSMNAHELTAQLIDPSDYDYVPPHSPQPVPNSLSHHHYGNPQPQNQLSRRMSDPTSQHIRKVMPMNQLSRHNSAEFPTSYGTAPPVQQQHPHPTTQHRGHPMPPNMHQPQHHYQHVHAPPPPQQHTQSLYLPTEHVDYMSQPMHSHPSHHPIHQQQQPHQQAAPPPPPPPSQQTHIHHMHHQPTQHPIHMTAPLGDMHHHHHAHQGMPPPMQTTHQYSVECAACNSHAPQVMTQPQAPVTHYYVNTTPAEANPNPNVNVQSVNKPLDSTPQQPPPQQPAHTVDPRLLKQESLTDPAGTPHGPPNPEVFYEPHLPASPRT